MEQIAFLVSHKVTNCRVSIFLLSFSLFEFLEISGKTISSFFFSIVVNLINLI